MKYILFAFISIATLLSTASATSQSALPIAQPKIVGGEIASQGDWPWMSALVFTYDEVMTSLEVAGTSYNSSPFENSSGQVSATMVDCGIGDNQCSLATDKICLIARGEINFSEKVMNCQAGGGIGAIIYNNVAGDINGTLGEDFSSTIPVIAISQDDGATLLTKLDDIATITVADQQSLAQSASCGATFIGEKWLITASHCVEDANIEFLKVNVGEYDLSNGADNAKAIKQIYMHPEYNEGEAFNNDIALIELYETIDHPAVTLLDFDSSRELALANSPATVIGWGNRTAYASEDELPTNTQPDTLHQVELSLLSNEQCKDKLAQGYSDLFDANYSPEQVGISDSMICAEYTGGGKGSCQGDSGGPLVVKTNQGWQQIGIVSYGVGCADAAFPDVYARVGKFTSWIHSITQGVAIEPSYDFAITPQFSAQSKQLNITNNSDLSANLTFTLTGTNLSSSGFNLVTENCTNLAAKQSCQLQVNFDATAIGEYQATININSNDINIPTSQAFINAQAIAANSAINTQLSNGSTEFSWFSGGAQDWLLDNTEAAIISGSIGDGQQSSVMLTFSGAGSLSFDWAVSSEENTDTPDKPYDALFLIVDGEQVDFISGEVAYTRKAITDLAEGEHQITWLYKKDSFTSDGEDRGYLKNVVFNSKTSSSAPSPSNQTTKKSSSGSLSYFSLWLLVLIAVRRYRY